MVYQLPKSELIAQGAEARIYKCAYLGRPTLIKERFEKKYRHPILDAKLTKERTKAEARSIVRAKAAGVRTPMLYLVDFERRSIFMEFVENSMTLKEFIEKHLKSKDHTKIAMNLVADEIGRVIAKLHSNNVIHGDLTTCNFLVRDAEEWINAKAHIDIADKIVVIDFGLSQVECMAEDAAVDLYVMERSLNSVQTELPELFESIYTSYRRTFKNKKHLNDIVIKFEDVKSRGRKRSMVG